MFWLSIEEGGFATNQIFVGLSSSGEINPGAIHQQLAGARTGVVIGSCHETVSARGQNCKQIARSKRRKVSAAREKITCFANRADDIGGNWFAAGGLFYGEDFVIGVIQSGTDEIVHRGVDNDERLSAILLHE